MSQIFHQPPDTPLGPLPPHKKYQVESSGLQYRMFCSYTLSPSREFGVARDLYVVAEPALLFYKENTTADRCGKWRLALDDFLIHHPNTFQSSTDSAGFRRNPGIPTDSARIDRNSGIPLESTGIHRNPQEFTFDTLLKT